MPLPVQVFGVALGLALVSIASVGGARLYAYVQDDPAFCRSCHGMELAWDRWSQSAHSSVRCGDCHQQSTLASAEQLVKYAMRDPRNVSKHSSVGDESCVKCHASDNPRWSQIASTAGHRKHVEEEKIACTKCHSLTIHRSESSKQVCGACHTERQVKVPEMANLHCLTCHDFLTTQTNLLPDRERCLTCHIAMPQVKVTWPSDAPMKWKCGSCHKPHEQSSVWVGCVACHEKAGLGGLHAETGHTGTACETCHRPHEWRVSTRGPCLACHTN